MRSCTKRGMPPNQAFQLSSELMPCGGVPAPASRVGTLYSNAIVVFFERPQLKARHVGRTAVMTELHVTEYREPRALESGREVVDLSITKVRITREVRRKLRSLTKLETLRFVDCDVPGQTFALIAALPLLRSLGFHRSKLDLKDAAQREDGTWRSELDHLHTIPGLCELDLTETVFHIGHRAQGTRDFDFLSKMGALTTLILDGTPFDDSCVGAILPLTKLRRLSLRNTHVRRKAGLLERMPNLEELILGNSADQG